MAPNYNSIIKTPPKYAVISNSPGRLIIVIGKEIY